MSERLICLDTSVLIRYLTPDEQEEAATALVLGALTGGGHLVAPAWQWAEIGSVLRKKVRRSLLTADEAAGIWTDFLALPVETIVGKALAVRAWELAHRYELRTLYDAAMLACVEVAARGQDVVREFWTADAALVHSLGAEPPATVHVLGSQ